MRDTYDPWKELKLHFQEVKELYDLAVEEDDESVAEEIAVSLGSLRATYEQLKVLRLLGEENDTVKCRA